MWKKNIKIWNDTKTRSAKIQKMNYNVNINPSLNPSTKEMKNKCNAIINIIKSDSITCAMNYDNVVVLNFANPKIPSLNIPKSNTQEEDLLRRTSLCNSLFNNVDNFIPNTDYPIGQEKNTY